MVLFFRLTRQACIMVYHTLPDWDCRALMKNKKIIPVQVYEELEEQFFRSTVAKTDSSIIVLVRQSFSSTKQY